MVVVTGAAGHIGANLVRALSADGRKVRAVMNKDDRALRGLSVETVRADILDPHSLRDAFRGAGTVYHLAARISLERKGGAGAPHTVRVNLEGTRNVIRACRASGARRLVYFGTIHSLDPFPREGTVDETRGLIGGKAGGFHLHTPGPYDHSKAAAEREVLAACRSGLDAVVVSPTAVVGPYDFKPSQFGGTLLAILRDGHRVLVKGGFDWVDVRDVAAGAIAAERAGKRGERYILSGGWRSVGDVMKIADNIVGRTAPRAQLPMWTARACLPIGRVFLRRGPMKAMYTKDSLFVLRHYRRVSSLKAERELGFRRRPFEQTMRDTIGWFYENGYLDREGRSE